MAELIKLSLSQELKDAYYKEYVNMIIYAYTH